MIIGLTGTFASGKDTIADYLKNRGFIYHSCSDIIREECRKIGQETNRENLINMGNKLRKEFGDGCLAEKILQKIRKKQEKDSLVVSIRHPKEVQELRKNSDFIFIMVDAPLKIRYARIQKREGRPEDNTTFAEFIAHEQRERKGKGHSQQLDSVAKMADYKIDNSKSLKELYNKIDNILKEKNV